MVKLRTEHTAQGPITHYGFEPQRFRRGIERFDLVLHTNLRRSEMGERPPAPVAELIAFDGIVQQIAGSAAYENDEWVYTFSFVAPDTPISIALGARR